MVTSRRRKRWILPKGWPEAGRTPSQAAAQEAWEEAGATGKVWDRCLGVYSYRKVNGPRAGATCVAMVYPIKVKTLATEYPEQHERARKWFSRKQAVAHVEEPELKAILKTFDPAILKKDPFLPM